MGVPRHSSALRATLPGPGTRSARGFARVSQVNVPGDEYTGRRRQISLLSLVLVNFLLAGERRQLSVRQLMAAPYLRIVILHVAILGGAFAITLLGQPLLMLLLLVLLKLALDVQLHLREHRAIARA